MAHPPSLEAQTGQAPGVEVVEVKIDGAGSLTPAERQDIEVVDVTIEGAETLGPLERSQVSDKLKGTTITHGDWLEGLQEEASRFLADQGFLQARVSLREEVVAEDGHAKKARLTATIEEKHRFHLVQIWWSGVSSFSTKQLADLLLLKPGDVFRPSLVMKSEELLRHHYTASGYPGAIVFPQWQLYPEISEVALYVEVREGKGQGAAQPSADSRKQLKGAGCGSKKAGKVELPVTHYDPKRNGQADLIAAKLEAKRTNRNVLMIVGGEWCGWCRVLDDTFEKFADLRATRDANFVTVYINFSAQNHNPCAFLGLPEPKAFPKVYVLDSAGRLLRMDDTSDWQFAGGYDSRRIALFFTSASKEKAPAVAGAKSEAKK